MPNYTSTHLCVTNLSSFLTKKEIQSTSNLNGINEYRNCHILVTKSFFVFTLVVSFAAKESGELPNCCKFSPEVHHLVIVNSHNKSINSSPLLNPHRYQIERSIKRNFHTLIPWRKAKIYNKYMFSTNFPLYAFIYPRALFVSIT